MAEDKEHWSTRLTRGLRHAGAAVTDQAQGTNFQQQMVATEMAAAQLKAKKDEKAADRKHDAKVRKDARNATLDDNMENREYLALIAADKAVADKLTLEDTQAHQLELQSANHTFQSAQADLERKEATQKLSQSTAKAASGDLLDANRSNIYELSRNPDSLDVATVQNAANELSSLEVQIANNAELTPEARKAMQVEATTLRTMVDGFGARAADNAGASGPDHVAYYESVPPIRRADVMASANWAPIFAEGDSRLLSLPGLAGLSGEDAALVEAIRETGAASYSSLIDKAPDLARSLDALDMPSILKESKRVRFVDDVMAPIENQYRAVVDTLPESLRGTLGAAISENLDVLFDEGTISYDSDGNPLHSSTGNNPLIGAKMGENIDFDIDTLDEEQLYDIVESAKEINSLVPTLGLVEKATQVLRNQAAIEGTAFGTGPDPDYSRLTALPPTEGVRIGLLGQLNSPPRSLRVSGPVNTTTSGTDGEIRELFRAFDSAPSVEEQESLLVEVERLVEDSTGSAKVSMWATRLLPGARAKIATQLTDSVDSGVGSLAKKAQNQAFGYGSKEARKQMRTELQTEIIEAEALQMPGVVARLELNLAARVEYEAVLDSGLRESAIQNIADSLIHDGSGNLSDNIVKVMQSTSGGATNGSDQTKPPGTVSLERSLEGDVSTKDELRALERYVRSNTKPGAESEVVTETFQSLMGLYDQVATFSEEDIAHIEQAMNGAGIEIGESDPTLRIALFLLQTKDYE
jgi:hypothetical protein